jgi:ParB/RepB/Spo0J family partition protein
MNDAKQDAAKSTQPTSYQIRIIQMDELFLDEEFNCRGKITPGSCLTLAQDIARDSLLQPIGVQPIDMPRPDGGVYRWKVVFGHRRTTACRDILGWKEIKAIVYNKMSNIEALIVNFSENHGREGLSIAQEAVAVQRIMRAGLSKRDMAKRLQVTSSWLDTRIQLLQLPQYVQSDVVEGRLRLSDVSRLWRLRDDKAEMEAMYKTLVSKTRGEELQRDKASKEIEKRHAPSGKAIRSSSEVIALIQFFREEISTIDGEPASGIHTRCLAWASGQLSNQELQESIQEFVNENALVMAPGASPFKIKPHLL